MNENKKQSKAKINLEEEIIKYQNGSNESLDLIFNSLMPEIKKVARIYKKKYSYICADIDEYEYFIYLATTNAIKSFSLNRGEFIKYWRFCIMNQKSKFIKKQYNLRSRDINCISISEGFDDVGNYVIVNDSGTNLDMNAIKKREYLKDLKEQAIQIAESYSKQDGLIISLYIDSYSFEDISIILKMPKNSVISRFYYLMKIIRSKLKIDDFVL